MLFNFNFRKFLSHEVRDTAKVFNVMISSADIHKTLLHDQFQKLNNVQVSFSGFDFCYFLWFLQKKKLPLKNFTTLHKTVWKFLKNVKIEVPYDLAISLLRTYPKKTKTLIQKHIRTPMFIATLYVIAKIRKPPRCGLINR